jgi:hypothetical protein
VAAAGVFPVGSGRFVVLDPGLHERLQEFGRQLANIGEFDEALTGLVAGGLNRSFLGGKERWREPKRAVILEILEHPKVRIFATHVDRQVIFQFLPRLGVSIEAELPERLEVRPLNVIQLPEVVINIVPLRHRHALRLPPNPAASPSRLACTTK